LTVDESAPQQTDRVLTRSVCVIRITTVGQYFNWYRASRGSLCNSWAACLL